MQEWLVLVKFPRISMTQLSPSSNSWDPSDDRRLFAIQPLQEGTDALGFWWG